MSNKAIFLDRDDTIIEDPGYISSPDQVKLLQFASSAVADFRKMGYKVVVVSNQSGIARGIISEQVLGQIHEKLKQLLGEQNAYLDRIYYCPYHPDGVIQKYRKDSDGRKPKPGMLLAAAKEMNLKLSDSWMIGNTYQDVAAGKAAGCRTILIKQYLKLPVKKQGDVDADFEAVNLREAVNIVKRDAMPKPVAAVVPVPAKIPAAVAAPVAPPAAVSPAPSVAVAPPTPPIAVPSVAAVVTPAPTISPQPVVAEPVKPVVVPEPIIKPVAMPEPIKVEPVVVEKPVEREIVPQPFEEKEEEQMEEPKAAEVIEEKPQRQKPVDDVEIKVPAGDSSKTEKLLEEIRLLMKSRNRQELYTEFSVLKLFAGFMQIVALACMFIALRYKMSLTPADSAVYTSLGFAVFFQIMTLTLYVMHRDK